MRYDISLLFSTMSSKNSIQQTDQKSSQDVALQIAALHWLQQAQLQPGQFSPGVGE